LTLARKKVRGTNPVHAPVGQSNSASSKGPAEHLAWDWWETPDGTRKIKSIRLETNSSGTWGVIRGAGQKLEKKKTNGGGGRDG